MKSEPIVSYLKIPQHIIEEHFWEEIKLNDYQKCSSACIYEPTQTLVGVSTSCASYVYSEKLNSYMEPMVNFYKEVDREFFESNPEQSKFGCYYLEAGVLEEYAGNQICYNLNCANVLLAKRNGYTFMLSQDTGPVSQHIAINKLKHIVLKKKDYSSFEFNGERVFKDLEGFCLFSIKPI